MDLRAKLGRLRVDSLQLTAAEAAMPENFVPDAAKTERIARLRALIGEVTERDRRRTASSVASRVASALTLWPPVSTPHGDLHVVERLLEPDHHHGRAPVRDGLFHQRGTLTVLTRDSSLMDLDLTNALFLDTETTGLAGGTGTVAFLVGLGRFDDGVLCLEQLVVPNLGAEAPVLVRLAERIAAASCVVTYNGKSFDWPLLRTRFVLNRLPVPVLPAHVDLLHTARSIWKHRLASVRLTEIEREILGFEREHDIAGAEIPARYFEFLRDGLAERLTPVLEHNQNDLIALAALLGALITRLEQVETRCDARDAVAFGRLALRMRDADRALACARAALASSEEVSHTRHALLFASDVRRQLGESGKAAELLEQALLAASGPAQRATIHFALTKMYEHELRELTRALRHARHTELVEGPLAQGRRLGRLHRRLLSRSRTLSRSDA